MSMLYTLNELCRISAPNGVWSHILGNTALAAKTASMTSVSIFATRS